MILVKMHMVNFGPFEDSTVNFNFSSALITGENLHIAGASNGTGKSTIFQALAWALTGYSRYKNSASIIRDKTDSTKVELDFNVGTEKYRIIRGRNRTNKQTLDFYQVKAGGALEVIKADTNSRLDDKISEITKIRYDSFLNTCYFAQNSISEFMYGTAAVRQKLIAEILDLDRWNTYSKKAAQLLSESDGELDILKFKMSQLKSNEARRTAAAASIVEAEAEALKLRASLSQLQSEADAAAVDAVLERSALSVAANIESVRSEIVAKDNEIAKLKKDSAYAQLEADNIIIPTAVTSPGDQPADSSDIANKLAQRKGQLEFLQRRITAMKEGKCDGCGTNWDNHDEKHAAELSELEAQKSDFLSRIQTGELAYQAAQKASKDWLVAFTAHSENRSAVAAAELRANTASAKVSAINTRMGLLSAESARLAEKLAAMPVAAPVAAGVLQRLQELQRQIRETSELILKAETRRSSAAAEMAVIASAAQELAEMQARKLDLEEKVGTYSVLAKHFSKTGIQANILDTVISEIETLSNKFMSKLNYKPFTIKFVTQKADTKGQIKETLDVEVVTPDSVKYIEDLSGGEQFRVAFSVRLALAAVQARRQGGEINVLLLDEVSSSLDKVGIETFVSIIRELEKTMKVMLITHDDSLKEHFDTTIHVQSNGTTAKIIQK
jgi:DNA repair exonuclease SbcCD ATPase subunit